MEKSSIPNYQRIKQQLLQDIEQGNYRPDQLFITQQEVCQRFQVSRITAERALNELVRDGVLVRRRGLGTFVAEMPAVGSASNNSPFQHNASVIACIFSVTRSDHKNAIIRGIDHICREADCHFLFFDSGEDPSIEASNVQRAIKAGVSGIIIYPVDGLQNQHLFETVLQDDIPLVMVDRYYTMLPTDVVVPDNLAAGYEITKSLIEQGHRTIGTVWQEIACTSVEERLIGYRQALREANLPILANIATLRSYTSLSDEERRALLSSWLTSPSPPTALIAANSHTLGIVAVDLLNMGVQIGTDMVLAAMDKDDPGITLTLGSASVTLPSYEMGCEAMRVLLKRMRHCSTPPEHVILPIKFQPPASVVINAHVPVAE